MYKKLCLPYRLALDKCGKRIYTYPPGENPKPAPRMKKILSHPRSIPLAFALACLLAYGLLVPWLGFYWDDWPYTWFAHTLGPQGLIRALDGDRPFLAAIYIATTSLFNSHPLAWQIFALVTRLGSVLVLWWTLRLTWPRAPRQVAWVGLLFAVYPGFRQHWISVIYSQAYVLLAATLLSLALMVYTLDAYSQRPWRSGRYMALTALALGLSAFSLFSTEYFFGVELVRPLLLWFALSEREPIARRRARKVLVHWLPYLGLLAFFGIWRAFIFQASTYQVQALGELSQGVFATLLDLARTMLSFSYTGGLHAWGQTFGVPELLNFSLRTTQITWAVIIISFVLFLAYLLNLRWSALPAAESETQATGWSRQAILTGSALLVFSVLPFWAGGLPFDLEFPYNRFSLAMMPGSALLVVGLLEFFIRTLRQKTLLLSILLAAAIGFQFQAANTFRRDLDNMRDLFWQMTWRMPDLQPGTLLLTYELPLRYYTDNSLSAPLNTVYAPENHSDQMPYILLYLRARKDSVLDDLSKDTPLGVRYRATHFKGNTSDTVVFQYSPPGCFRVLDRTYNTAEMVEMRAPLQKTLGLTDFSRILLEPGDRPQPPTELFGVENRDTWCYYYEKADLARQVKDWAGVVALEQQARAAGLSAGEPSEMMVFMDGYAMTGDWSAAQAISQQVHERQPKLQGALCAAWKRYEKRAQPDADGNRVIQEVKEGLQCSP